MARPKRQGASKKGLSQKIPPRNEQSTSTNFLSALFTIAETATQSLDTEKILNDTLDKALEILKFDVGIVRVVDPEAGNTLIRIDRGFREPRIFPARDQRNVVRKMIETKEPYISRDIREDPIHGPTLRRDGVLSAAHAPVMSKRRVLGALTVGSRKFHKFTQREVDLLRAFGHQLGLAMETAHDKIYIQSLVENAGDAIVSTDRADRILTWNPAAEVIFGYNKDEVLGRSLAILLPADHLRELEEIRDKVQLTGVIRNLEVRRKRKDGRIIDVALAVSAVKDNKGNIIRFLLLAKDISEKKRFEERLKELDKMKSEFVSNVSHELRTPLTAIKGSVDNMLDGITGPLNEKQSRYLTRIKSNSDRLSRLIDEILDLSRIEAGRIDLKPTNLVLEALIQEVTECLRPMAAENLISLEADSPDSGVTAWADRDKVIQILVNLIGNAIKFNVPQGNVNLAVKKNGDEWVQISVTDTGPGIPREEANVIFDKFYQITQARKQKTKGAGLGLAICKSLVEMQGGRIWLETEVGKGSTFSFTLPSHQPFHLNVPTKQ